MSVRGSAVLCWDSFRSTLGSKLACERWYRPCLPCPARQTHCRPTPARCRPRRRLKNCEGSPQLSLYLGLFRAGRSRVLARGYPDGKFGFIYVIGRAVPPLCYSGGQTSSCPPLSLSLFLSLSRSRTHTHSLSLAHTHSCSGTAQAWTRGQICGGVRLCVLQLPRRRPGGRQASNNVAHRGLPDRALLGQGVAAVREPFDCDDTQRVTQPVLPELWQHGKPVSHQQWPGRMQGPRSQPF